MQPFLYPPAPFTPTCPQASFPANKKRPYYTSKEYFSYYALLGITPWEWEGLRTAFLRAIKEVPYSQELELGDVDNPNGALARFFSEHVIAPACQEITATKALFLSPAVQQGLGSYLGKIIKAPEDKMVLGSKFYKCIFEEFPDVLEYFADTDIDAIAGHLMSALVLLTHGGAGLHSTLLKVSS